MSSPSGIKKEMVDFTCLILADGKGTRFGMEKQFFSWRGKALWEHVYNTIADLTPHRIVVGIDIAGGTSRQASVKSGLRLVDTERVIILEACAPLVTQENIEELLKVNAPSISYAFPSNDLGYWNPLAKEYYSPQKILSLTCPQAFSTEKLLAAHKRTHSFNAADDTCLIKEVFNLDPYIIIPQKPHSLYKIIYPEDIFVIENLL